MNRQRIVNAEVQDFFSVHYQPSVSEGLAKCLFLDTYKNLTLTVALYSVTMPPD
jgi:hypothetical protein